jgi:hypothetical protein
MFTASGKTRQRRTRFNVRATVMIIAVLVFANFIAIAWLGATAHAQDFPNALPYAPLTWEKRAVPATETPTGKTVAMPRAATGDTVSIQPVRRSELQPARHVSERSFTATPFKRPENRLLIVALVAVAFGAMAGVSVHMFRSLARELSDAERKRPRLHG